MIAERLYSSALILQAIDGTKTYLLSYSCSANSNSITQSEVYKLNSIEVKNLLLFL